MAQLLIESARNNSGFSFHPWCDKVKLTHLCLADNLLIFSKGMDDSVSAIKRVLMEFESLSGLWANPDKSTIFCVGVLMGSRIRLWILFIFEKGSF